MEYSRSLSGTAGRLTGPGKFLLPVALLVIGPLRPAHAYIDPNAAGPLYQMLLPMLIAIGSAIAMIRRYIRHFWQRSIEACASIFSRKSAREDNEHLPP
jgi:hypothetical protein